MVKGDGIELLMGVDAQVGALWQVFRAGTQLFGLSQVLGGACAPSIEFLRVYAVLTAPCAAAGFIHGRSGDHGIEPGRR